MELNDLKSGWQNASGSVKTETELQRMTKINNHPSLKRVRTKLVIETIGLTLFLIVYYDWFDGDQKPLYANLVLVGAVALYILNDIIGYVALRNPVSGANLKLSVGNYLQRIRQLSVFSLVISLLFSASVIVFFTSVIDFTREKRLILAGILLVLIQMMLWSFRVWNKRIGKLRQQVADFEGNTDFTD